MGICYGLHHSQTEAGAIAARGKKGIKNLMLQMHRHTWTMILNRQGYELAITAGNRIRRSDRWQHDARGARGAAADGTADRSGHERGAEGGRDG